MTFELGVLTSRRELAADAVFEALRTRIVEGRYQPGERLIEPELAASLRVSRTPLREALRKLEAGGYIERLATGRILVVGIDIDDLQELWAVRSILEGLIARDAAQRATAADVAALQSIVEQMDALLDRPAELVELGAQLHGRLAVIAKNRRCERMLADIRQHLNRYWAVTLPEEQGRREAAPTEHRSIIAAIARHRPNEAERAMRHHIQAGAAGSIEVMRRYMRLNDDAAPPAG
jgi:DNA-binding GntR family transcriptional regulator